MQPPARGSIWWWTQVLMGTGPSGWLHSEQESWLGCGASGGAVGHGEELWGTVGCCGMENMGCHGMESMRCCRMENVGAMGWRIWGDVGWETWGNVRERT